MAGQLAGEGHGLSARAAWNESIVIGRAMERVATSHVSVEDARTILRGIAQSIACEVAAEHRAAMRERVLHRAHNVFFEYVRNAAASFENADASMVAETLLSTIIEAIKIIDDVHDEEPRCLATEIGVDAALNVATFAYAWSLEQCAALPLSDERWRSATVAAGRGIRETAIGQLFEMPRDGGFDAFWQMVDSKTPPLVATALELGALMAGADPHRAADLTRLAVPLGRILQIGDDCLDALGPCASDFRTPELNLLLHFTMSGPRGEELASLMRHGEIRAAQILLLRDGAIAYAMHAQASVLRALAETLDALALPNPAPFRDAIASSRTAAEDLLRQCGLSEELVARVV